MWWKPRVSSPNASRSPCFACRVSASTSIAPPSPRRCQKGRSGFGLSRLARGALAKHVGPFLGGKAQPREDLPGLGPKGAGGGGVPEAGVVQLDRVGDHAHRTERRMVQIGGHLVGQHLLVVP